MSASQAGRRRFESGRPLCASPTHQPTGPSRGARCLFHGKWPTPFPSLLPRDHLVDFATFCVRSLTKNGGGSFGWPVGSCRSRRNPVLYTISAEASMSGLMIGFWSLALLWFGGAGLGADSGGTEGPPEVLGYGVVTTFGDFGEESAGQEPGNCVSCYWPIFCSLDEHRAQQDLGSGAYLGAHSFCSYPEDCSGHPFCNEIGMTSPEGLPEPMSLNRSRRLLALVRSVGDGDMGAVNNLLVEYPGIVKLNRARSALQVYGCGGDVSAHVPVSPGLSILSVGIM